MKKKTKKTVTPVKIAKEVKQVAERLKSLRVKKGYTSYEAFANDHDLSRALYGRYEKGKDMRISSLAKIVKAHGMSLEEFFSEGFD
jgi:transcriptional regulator with XRE-family HTH domain